MLHSTDDAQIMMDAVGEAATIEGEPLTVLFRDTEQAIDYRSEQMVRVDPFCLALAADVVALGIHGDPNGSLIHIGEADYRVLAVDPDGPLFATLSLEVVNG